MVYPGQKQILLEFGVTFFPEYRMVYVVTREISWAEEEKDSKAKVHFWDSSASIRHFKMICL